ncbi:hypothetical protein BKA62DRAFT_707818 [Auriculariales sp. MPI-PUGE-AT-0066]|nr:hypothetical protein BKA62DRAFT_707818 [Auriculariales sp. MPI-PUGE-AT-0066]
MMCYKASPCTIALRTTSTMRLLHAATLVLAVVPAVWSCETDEDCSLNGICILSSDNSTVAACQCDPGWRTADCGELDLVPVERWTGYNNTNATGPDFYQQGHPSEPTLFHLIIAQMAHGCGLGGWRPFSEVIRAESRTGPRGPFLWAQTLFSTFRHNPTTIWSPADNAYLLYMIGKDVVPPTTCSSSKFTNEISVARSTDLRNWSEPIVQLVGQSNPAPWPLWTEENPTSEMLLAVAENDVYTAATWPGPYNLTVEADKTVWTEDPFLWRDRRGYWHLLVHYMIDITENNVKYPRWTGPWTINTQTLAYNTTVLFTDGGRNDYNRRERPKLFFSDDGTMTPLYLINGVQEMNTSASYTLIQPIGTKWQEYEANLGF